MKLAIITVNYKSRILTASLIESLLRANLPKQVEIIVVDNNSQDNSVELLRSDFPEVTVIANEENLGLAGGVNTAMKSVKSDYYLILNPDMTVEPDAVTKLVAFMDRNETVGMAGGKLLSPGGELQASCFRFYTPMIIVYRRTWLGKTKRGQKALSEFLMEDFDHASAVDVDWLMGACLIVRGKAITQVGGMDERYFMYFEDVDWGRRMWEAGWRVSYVPDARFSHFHQRSSEQGILSYFTNRPTREHIKSALKYFWKYQGKRYNGTHGTASADNKTGSV
ncbi:MAG: glycosyltransferase family 2 protein [Candidatus Andersenbacteria bacterium]|nr:glycosyltransferase family 2 protein [Candidatus Andersenbacteria bacterium]MBI3250301.1 glycosyltransferase family 2 protein [Candidatus Andersenbacteria bacterium]